MKKRKGFEKLAELFDHFRGGLLSIFTINLPSSNSTWSSRLPLQIQFYGMYHLWSMIELCLDPHSSFFRDSNKFQIGPCKTRYFRFKISFENTQGCMA
jgi:hypothetical protein